MTLAHILEVLFARIIPGLLNVLGILLIGERLTTEVYGIFSTILVTAGFFGNVIYGPLSGAILPLYNKLARESGDVPFQGVVIGAGLKISIFIVLASAALQLFRADAIIFGVLLALSGMQVILLAILQAKLKFWIYGFVSGSQSISFLGLVVLFIGSDSTSIEAVWCYGISIAIATIVGYMALGMPRVVRSDWAVLMPAFKLGSQVTGGALAESSMFLGFRYALMMFGDRVTLGQFSFLLDIAQRTAGVAISIIGFAVLPRAYLVASHGDIRIFRKILLRGGISAIVVSMSLLLGMIVIADLNIFGILSDGRFSTSLFFVVTLGVILNRLKKVIVDARAIQKNVAYIIPAGYLIGGIFSLSSAVYFLQRGDIYVFYISYLCGYAGVLLVTLLMLARVMRNSR